MTKNKKAAPVRIRGFRKRATQRNRKALDEAQKELALAIRRAREAQGLRQLDVAAAIRTGQSYLARLEAGTQRIDIIEYLALAILIGFDPCEMIRALNFPHRVQLPPLVDGNRNKSKRRDAPGEDVP